MMLKNSAGIIRQAIFMLSQEFHRGHFAKISFSQPRCSVPPINGLRAEYPPVDGQRPHQTTCRERLAKSPAGIIQAE